MRQITCTPTGLLSRRAAAKLIIGGAITPTLASPAAAQTAQSPPYHLIQAGFRVLYIAPVFVALEKGFFAEHGVDYSFKEIDSGALGPAALLSGAVQIGDADIGQAADLQKQHHPLLLVYNLVDRVTTDLIVKPEVLTKAGIDAKAPLGARLKALKGVTFGITRPGAPTDIYARYFLLRAGLNPDRDANLVQIGGIGALEAAFRTGRIDAFILSPPLPQKLERDGTGVIIVHNTLGELPDLDNVSMDTIATTAEFARNNGPAIRAYLAAVKQAIAWIKQNPDETVKLLSVKWFKDTSPEDLAIALRATIPALSDTGAFSVDAIKKQAKISRDAGQTLDVDPAEDVLWTNKYLS